jgi:hypothetical protein
MTEKEELVRRCRHNVHIERRPPNRASSAATPPPAWPRRRCCMAWEQPETTTTTPLCCQASWAPHHGPRGMLQGAQEEAVVGSGGGGARRRSRREMSEALRRCAPVARGHRIDRPPRQISSGNLDSGGSKGWRAAAESTLPCGGSRPAAIDGQL